MAQLLKVLLLILLHLRRNSFEHVLRGYLQQAGLSWQQAIESRLAAYFIVEAEKQAGKLASEKALNRLGFTRAEDPWQNPGGLTLLPSWSQRPAHREAPAPPPKARELRVGQLREEFDAEWNAPTSS